MVFVTLTNPSNAALGTPAEASVTIMEDDAATADLTLTMTDTPDPIIVGQVLTYTIIVENLGPEDAIATVVTDTLPAGVEFISASGMDWSCGELGGIVSCEHISLQSYAISTIEILVRVPLIEGMITNTAEVSSSILDPNPDNNQVTETTSVKMRKVFLPMILR